MNDPDRIIRIVHISETSLYTGIGRSRIKQEGNTRSGIAGSVRSGASYSRCCLGGCFGLRRPWRFSNIRSTKRAFPKDLFLLAIAASRYCFFFSINVPAAAAITPNATPTATLGALSGGAGGR